jgi:hypothetical protein
VLRWSSDGKRLAFAWNSTAIRVLDASAPDGNLITSSTLLAAIGTTVSKHSSVTCNASQGWELIAVGHGVICAGSMHPDGPPTSVVIGSLVWDGHLRFGVFRNGRFTPLPALPVSVPVPTGVLIGTYDW